MATPDHCTHPHPEQQSCEYQCQLCAARSFSPLPLWWIGLECTMPTMMPMRMHLMKNCKWFKRSSKFDGNWLKVLQCINVMMQEKSLVEVFINFSDSFKWNGSICIILICCSCQQKSTSNCSPKQVTNLMQVVFQQECHIQEWAILLIGMNTYAPFRY